MTPLEAHFVKPLSEFYGRNPFGPGFAQKLAPHVGSLDAEALQAVAMRLAERSKSFPAFAACRQALIDAERAASSPVSTEIRPWDTKAIDAAARRDRLRACQICRCALGETADREGWLVALIDFATDTGRLPSGAEIERCRAQAQRSEDALHASASSPFYENLIEWRKEMLDRAHRDVFGGPRRRDETRAVKAADVSPKREQEVYEKRLEEMKAQPVGEFVVSEHLLRNLERKRA